MRESLETPHHFAIRLRHSGEPGYGDGAGPSAAEGLRLTSAFMRVRSKPVRSYLISLAEALAGLDGVTDGSSALADGVDGRSAQAKRS